MIYLCLYVLQGRKHIIASKKSKVYMSRLLNVESLVRLELDWFTNELFTQQQ